MEMKPMMHKVYFTRNIVLTVLASFVGLFSYAQPQLKTSVDKSEILIGDQFKVSYEAAFDPETFQVKWPELSNEIPHFEIINTHVDSVYTNNKLSSIVQTLTLTSFDSGRWIFPSVKINFQPFSQPAVIPLYADSVPITVSFSTSDTTGVLKDIKPLRQVETVNPLWYWVAGGILLLLLIAVIVWLYKRNKKTGVKKPIIKSNLSPYEEAMQELEALRKYNVEVPADIRQVHIQLAFILKQYLTRTQGHNCLTSTTADVLILLRNQQLNMDMLVATAASLRCSDAVKFAKYLPPASETENSLDTNKKLITLLHQDTIKSTS